MPRFVIEREMPGVGSLSTEDLHAGACQSNEVLVALAPRAQWQHSYVTGDKIYCVWIADDEEVIREHARRSGFPCTVISRVNTLIDPTTGETL
jgi:hypothetical protein